MNLSEPIPYRPKGQSLVSVLIAAAIMGIVMMAMASVFSYQGREARALSEKLASADLEKLLIASLSNGAVCQYVLATQSSQHFNASAVSPTTPQTITFPGPLYGSVNPGPPVTPGPVVAALNQPASGYSSSLVVNSIQLQITAGSGNTYLGNWLIGFDPTKTIRPIRPLSISTTLTVDTSTPNSQTNAAIVGCQGTGSGGTAPGVYYQFLTSGNSWTTPSATTPNTVFKITLVGGGGGGGGTGQSAGAGGGAGCAVIWYATNLAANAAYNYSVGAAGAGGASTCAPVCASTSGGNGGNTWITAGGVTVLAGGGGGGAGGDQGGMGGAGGTCVSGTIQIQGQSGMNSGASTIFGTGGNPSQNGSGYGSGGGASSGILLPGGAGAPGALLIEAAF